MSIDIIGLAFIILFFIRGYMKGIIVAAFSVLGTLLGIIGALKFSHRLAAWFSSHDIITSGWGQLISYLLLFILVIFLVRLVAKAVETFARTILLGMVNKAIGGVLYAFMAAVVWSTLLWIADRMHLIAPETIAESKTFSFFTGLAPWLFVQIGRLWPFAKGIFHDLEHFFEGVNQKLPQHVGADR